MDELWLYDRGIWAFNFNESDLNGDPQRLVDIAEEVIDRKLPFNFAGQLRIPREMTRTSSRRLGKLGSPCSALALLRLLMGPCESRRRATAKMSFDKPEGLSRSGHLYPGELGDRRAWQNHG